MSQSEHHPTRLSATLQHLRVHSKRKVSVAGMLLGFGASIVTGGTLPLVAAAQHAT